MSGQRTTKLKAFDWTVAAALTLVGLAMGFMAPASFIPQPLVLLVLVIVLMDVGLSAVVAARSGRSVSSILHFLVLVAFVGALFLVSILSGLKPELVVLLPLVVREIILIGKLV